MPVLPLIPLYIIYDNTVIDEEILLKKITQIPEYMKASAEDKKRVCLSLICLGSFFSELTLKDRQIDLFSAFEHVLSTYRKITQGIGNSEVLILLGTQPADGWQIPQEEIETEFRGLILTYWFEKGTVSGPRGLALDDLLKKISRPDLNPRHRVVSYETTTDIGEILVDAFQKLAGRLDKRLSDVGKIVETAL